MILNSKVHAALCICLSAALVAGNVQVSFGIDMLTAPARAFTMPAHALITPAHAESIYRTLIEHHYVERTGLFESFPDSSNRKLAQQASLYEQAAMGLLAIRFGDFDRARSLFNFLKESWTTEAEARHGRRGLSNFYNAEFGSEGIEKTIHAGPNAWAGLFAARLANATRNPDALQWSLDVAYWLANAVPHLNGAVAMGPVDDPHGAPWAHIFSTENNLSYDAFLTELLRSPVIDKDHRDALTSERDHVEAWIVENGVDRRHYTTRRGMTLLGNDSIQALDNVTWLISAIGPKRLAADGIDPEALMAQAAGSFEVTVEGHDGVDPTNAAEAQFVYLHDSAKASEPRRPETDGHRMIWYEGLGQYILALSVMADYAVHERKLSEAAAYRLKADHLTQSFDAAALSDGSSYAYATAGRFFRDGWRPAMGAHGPCPSLSSGIWRCFAGLGYDPISGHTVGGKRSMQVSVPTVVHVSQHAPAVLYGTSDEMARQAWTALNEKNWPLAVAQAQATVDEWSQNALDLQQKKMNEIGHVVDYNGEAKDRELVFKYWALNDVAAAYFIIGKASDETGHYERASAAFQQIVDHYSLAQVWDSQGWFWSPVDAVRNDYVQRDPSHYGRLVAFAVTSGDTGKQPN